MKNIKKPVIVILLFINTIGYAQQATETVKTSTGNSYITVSTMSDSEEIKSYLGTKSKEALNYAEQAQEFEVKKDFDNAIKYYLMAIKSDSDYVQAYDNLGIIYRRLGKLDKAIEVYKQSISINPIGKAAHENLASAYLMMKQYKNAYNEYEIIVKLYPNDPEGYFGYADINLQQSQLDAALTNANKALILYQNQKSPLINQAQYLIGIIYYNKGDNNNAIKYVKLAKENGFKISPEVAKVLKL